MRNLSSLCALVALLFTSCAGNELVGVHISLQNDGSGLVTTRMLMEPQTTGSPEANAQGVTWKGRAGLVCAQGSFQQLRDLKLGGGSLHFVADLEGVNTSLRVFVKRDPNAQWVRDLVPEQTQRQAMARVYDPTGRTKEIGDVVRLEISVPGKVISSGVEPSGRGIESAHESKRAYLLIPVRAALEKGNDLVWSVSW
ncbi:MAG TPA: hypothetical protein VFD82_20910 [Planctomycetota bacterium]|nr:hypothetical protein [Planctomycetota bacterium]